MGRRLRTLVLAIALCGVLVLPGVAVGSDDDREVRRTGACTASSSVVLRVEVDDDELELELEIETRRAPGTWQAIVLHDRRTAFRGVVPQRSNRSVRLRRTLPNYYGRETITVRASGPRAETCRVSVSV